MSENKKFEGIVSFLWRFIISGALLWWLFSKIDFPGIIVAVESSNKSYLLFACLTFLFLNLIIFLRWVLFIKAMNVPTSFWQAARYYGFGLFGNLFLPSAIGGDVIKAIGITQGMEKKEGAFASILLDRLSGFVAIAALGAIAYLFGGKAVHSKAVLGAVCFMSGSIFFVVLVLVNRSVYEFFCRFFCFAPKLKNFLIMMHDDIALMGNNKIYGFGAIALSFVSQTGLAFMYWMIAKGMLVDVNLGYFLIFSPIVCVVTTLPSIGGLGLREVGWVYLLAQVGVSEQISASMSLLSFAFMILVGLLGGALYVLTISSRRIQHYSQDSSVKSGIV